jgi:hypothetical protein
MNMNLLFLFFFGLLWLTPINAARFDAQTNRFRITKDFFQDKNTVLIKKIKVRINALKKQRIKLKSLKKWSTAQEETYIYKVAKLAENLEKLREKSPLNLTTDEIVKKLQKQLKYLNNARINKDASDSWTKKDAAIYQQKAAVFIDSIIKLRSNNF